MSHDVWVVRCDCLDADGEHFRVEASCAECAADTAASHKALGHTVTVRCPGELGRSKSTQTLIGGRRGW